MKRLRLTFALLAVPAAALAASGCGGTADSHESHGLQKLPAAQVQRMAAEALRSAGSVHLKGSGLLDGAPVKINLRFDGSSAAGTVVTGGVRIAITRIGDEFYLKADQAALKQLGASSDARRVGADRWLKLGRQQVTTLDGLSLAKLAGQLTANDSPLERDVAQATIDGKQVVVLSRKDGAKLYVANTGIAYPLRGQTTGRDAGRLEFTEYGAHFHITAPDHALDVGKLTERG
jgi:hypothetical protein